MIAERRKPSRWTLTRPRTALAVVERPLTPPEALGRLLVVNGLIRIAAAASGQLLAFLVADRHAAEVGIGSVLVATLGVAFYVTELFGAPLAGRLADRYGATRVLRAGPLLGAAAASMTAATALFGHATGLAIAVLIVARLAEGSSAACVVPPTLVVVARATPGSAVRRTRAMGLFEIGSLLGIIGGYAMAGVAWDAFGRGAFLLLAPIYFVAFALVPRLGHHNRERTRSLRGVLAKLGKQGAVPFAVAWLAVNAVVGLWVQYMPYLLRFPVKSPTQHLVGGFSGRFISIVFVGWGVTFLVGVALWSWLAPAMNRRKAMAISLGGLLGLAICLAFANHGPDVLPLVLAGVCVLVQSGFAPAAFAHLADITERVDSSRGTALGLYSLFLGLGQLAGGLLGAIAISRGEMDGLLVVTVMLGLVAMAGVGLMRRSV